MAFVLVLDKNPEPFGVWNINNKPSVFENTHCVSSKLYMTISDFPLPEKTPEFPHHSIILKYYKDYAKHFNLYPYIKQNCTIHTVKKENDKWTIRTNDKTYYASYVVIATGTVNDCPNIPNDEFYKNFTGEMYHSDSYEKIKNVEGKNILIVGGSDTASDCAMELKNKNKVTVSIKNGVWFQNRNVGANEPADMFYNRIYDYLIKNLLSKTFILTILVFISLSFTEDGNSIPTVSFPIQQALFFSTSLLYIILSLILYSFIAQSYIYFNNKLFELLYKVSL